MDNLPYEILLRCPLSHVRMVDLHAPAFNFYLPTCIHFCFTDVIVRFQETMIDPVVLLDPNDGVSYERSALEEWVARTGYEECLRPKHRLIESYACTLQADPSF